MPYRGPQPQRQLNQFRDNPLVNAGQTAVLKRALSASGGVAAGGLANSAYYQSRPITAVFAQAGPLMSQLTEAGLFVSGDVMMVSREQTQVNDLIVWGGQTFKVYSQARRAALDTAWVSHLRLMYNAPTALAVAAAFSPSQLSNLKAWYNPQTLSSLYQDSTLLTAVSANNDPLGGWKDLSGNNNHALQATAGSKLAYLTSGINGHPAIQAAGGTHHVQVTFGAALSQPVTVFIVIQPTVTANGVYAFYGADFTNFQALTLVAGKWTLNAGSDFQSSKTEDTNAHILVCQFNGASSKLWQDGGTADTGNANTKTMGGISIGSLPSTGSGIQANIGEIVILNEASSLATINQVGSYYSAMWGVTWTTAA